MIAAAIILCVIGGKPVYYIIALGELFAVAGVVNRDINQSDN